MWQKDRISKSRKDEAMQCKEQEKEQRDKMERCFAHKLVTNTELRRIITHTKGNGAGQQSDHSMHTRRERTAGRCDFRGGGENKMKEGAEREREKAVP